MSTQIYEAFSYLRVRDASAAIEFHGERSSKVVDPFGHEWYLGSKIEDVSRVEMQRRFAAMFENT